MNTTIEVNQMVAKYLTIEGILVQEENLVLGLDFYGMGFLMTATRAAIAEYEAEYQLDYQNSADADNDVESLFDSLMEVLENPKYYNRICKIVYLHLKEETDDHWVNYQGAINSLSELYSKES
jgi:hypothetical protein